MTDDMITLLAIAFLVSSLAFAVWCIREASVGPDMAKRVRKLNDTKP